MVEFFQHPVIRLMHNNKSESCLSWVHTAVCNIHIYSEFLEELHNKQFFEEATGERFSHGTQVSYPNIIINTETLKTCWLGVLNGTEQ